jgi:excisionase family DNA binding protein
MNTEIAKTSNGSFENTLHRAYSIADIAQRFGVSERHVQRMVSRGELHSVKLGRRRLIPRATISAWLAGKAA